jgi:hypothetical protein
MNGTKEKDMPASSGTDSAGKDLSPAGEDKQGMAGTSMDNQRIAGMDMSPDSAKHVQTGDQNQQTTTGMEMGSSTGRTPLSSTGSEHYANPVVTPDSEYCSKSEAIQPGAYARRTASGERRDASQRAVE